MEWCEKIIHLNLGSRNYYTMNTAHCLVGSGKYQGSDIFFVQRTS